MNPLGKLGNKIKYLTPDEQKYVIDNVQPEGVDISKLTESIQNFKQNKLTLDFVHGLFDGDGNITVYFTPNPSSSVSSQAPEGMDAPMDELQNEGREIKISIGMNFTVVQDRHNLSLLKEIKSYFDEKGGIYEISKECNLYKVGSKSDLMSVILPKMIDKESMELIKNCRKEELKLPLVKYNKIYYICKILEYSSSLAPKGGGGPKLKREIMDDILKLSYYVSRESANITLEEYIKNLNKKLFS
jgi:hypothetical protein